MNCLYEGDFIVCITVLHYAEKWLANGKKREESWETVSFCGARIWYIDTFMISNYNLTI